MIPHAAISRFKAHQRELLTDTYNQAWQHGVEGYEPDADPAQPVPEQEHKGRESALLGLALLRARSQTAYRAPTEPDPERRRVALAGAANGIDTMGDELAQLSPTPEQREEAQAEADAGTIEQDMVATAALAIAVGAWAESNGSRLNGGESAAWSGEQAGYAEAANQDGMLLQWQTEDDEHVCGDCIGLGELPPLPLSEFPTQPGQGDTECNVGCRCALEETGVPLTDELAPLSDVQGALLDKVAQQASERLDALAPSE